MDPLRLFGIQILSHIFGKHELSSSGSLCLRLLLVPGHARARTSDSCPGGLTQLPDGGGLGAPLSHLLGMLRSRVSRVRDELEAGK